MSGKKDERMMEREKENLMGRERREIGMEGGERFREKNK